MTDEDAKLRYYLLGRRVETAAYDGTRCLVFTFDDGVTARIAATEDGELSVLFDQSPVSSGHCRSLDERVADLEREAAKQERFLAEMAERVELASKGAL